MKKDDKITSENEAAETASLVADLTAQIAELNDKYLRTLAELENTRRRAAIDAAAMARNRTISVAEKILPLIDAIDAAIQHAPMDDGIRALAAAAAGMLTQIGIAKIETIGHPLNPAVHNAVTVVESDAAPGTIVDEMQTGYMLDDAVLRPAMVVVGK